MIFIIKKVSKNKDGRCLVTGFISDTNEEEKNTMSEMVEAYNSVTQYANLTSHLSCNGKTILFKSVPFDGLQMVLNFWVSSLGVDIEYKISKSAIYMDGYTQKSIITLIEKYPVNKFGSRV